MLAYLTRRIVQAVIIVFIVTIVVFVLLHMLPGGPAQAIIGSAAKPAEIKRFNQEYGLDKPLYQQYVTMIGNWATGNFGFSYKLNQSVGSLLLERGPKSLVLNVLSLGFTILVSIPLGVLQAVRRGKVFDNVATWLSFIFFAAPSFFIGILAIQWFSHDLSWFPPQAPQTDSVVGMFSDFKAMVLPIVLTAMGGAAIGARYMRSSVMDHLNKDYVRTALAKGCSNGRVMYKHVMRNAIIPIITLLGLSLPILFAGSLIIEQMFNFPGMGLLFWQAAQTEDYPIELVVVLLTAIATVIGNLIADVCYALLDPRVRLT